MLNSECSEKQLEQGHMGITQVGCSHIGRYMSTSPQITVVKALARRQLPGSQWLQCIGAVHRSYNHVHQASLIAKLEQTGDQSCLLRLH